VGRYQDSLNCFVRSYGNEAMAHYQLARMLHHLGQNDQARQCLQAALHRDPKLEPAQVLLAELTGQSFGAAVRPAGFTEGSPPDAGSEPAAAPSSRELLREGMAPQPAAARVILPPPPSSGNWQTGPDQ